MSFLELIRVGVYTQLEGSVTGPDSVTPYRFRFRRNAIDDMSQLFESVTGKNFSNRRIDFQSKDLYLRLQDIGFTNFTNAEWNVPEVKGFGMEGRAEYLRAVIDSIGVVDVEGMRPYIQISGHNKNSLKKLAYLFDGDARGPYPLRLYVRWRDRRATDIVDQIGGIFHNPRNARGAELIQRVRWREGL